MCVQKQLAGILARTATISRIRTFVNFVFHAGPKKPNKCGCSPKWNHDDIPEAVMLGKESMLRAGALPVYFNCSKCCRFLGVF
jgi:hypothetical protein